MAEAQSIHPAAKANPFYAGSYDGKPYFSQAAEDRLRCVRTFDAEQCRTALALPDLQKGVVVALNRRLGLLKRTGQA